MPNGVVVARPGRMRTSVELSWSQRDTLVIEAAPSTSPTVLRTRLQSCCAKVPSEGGASAASAPVAAPMAATHARADASSSRGDAASWLAALEARTRTTLFARALRLLNPYHLGSNCGEDQVQSPSQDDRMDDSPAEGWQPSDAILEEQRVYEGFRQQQQIHPEEYDTLEDVDERRIACLADLYNAVAMTPRHQAFVWGVVYHGRITMTGHVAAAWAADWTAAKSGSARGAVTFGSHDEMWQVRSSPRGTIGQPLDRGQVREIVVLIRSRSAPSVARVTIIKLQSMAPASSVSSNLEEVMKGYSTFGPVAVHNLGIHAFQHQGRAFLHKKGFLAGRHDFHVVLPAYQDLHDFVCDGPCAGQRRVVKVCPGYEHPIVVAGVLQGIEIPDRPTRQGVEAMQRALYANNKQHSTRSFAKRVHDCFPDTSENVTFAHAARLIFAAENCCDQASLVGILDLIANPVFDCALPDAVHAPCSIALVIAMAVRIACFPTRFGVDAGTLDDEWAAREACRLMESLLPSVVSIDTSGGDVHDDQRYAIDLAIEHFREIIHEKIDAADSKGVVDPEVRHAFSPGDGPAIKLAIHRSFQFLYRAGTAICMDVCGLTPCPGKEGPNVYNANGFAQSCYDAVEQARHHEAYEFGLGHTHPPSPPTRTTSRGARQMALARILCDVEHWLETGKYNGVVLRSTDVMRTECIDDQLRVEHTTDAEGNVTGVSVYRGDRPEAGPMVTAALADAPVVTGTPVVSGVTSTAATASGLSGSRKKQRAAARRAASSDDERAQARLASRSQRKGAANDLLIDHAMQSLQKKRDSRNREEMEVARIHRLSGHAIEDAAEVLSNVSQMGPAFGLSQLFDFQVFAVGKGTTIACAHCDRTVDVVENVAFAGNYGFCGSCKHPRCLHCVQKDIERACADPDAELRCSAAFGCRFCDPSEAAL